MEAHQDKMSFIADFLNLGGVEGANKYVTKAAQLLLATDALVDKATQQIHQAAAAVNNQHGPQTQQVGPGTQGAKPIDSLKPQNSSSTTTWPDSDAGSNASKATTNHPTCECSP